MSDALPPGIIGTLASGLKVIHIPDMPDGCIGVPTKMYEQIMKIRTPDDQLMAAVNKFNNGRCSTCGGLRDPISGDIVHYPGCK